MIIAREPCLNFNHGRPSPPVRYCPSCGEVVNNSHTAEAMCSQEKHAKHRRNRNKYCTDCGKQLVKLQ